MRSNLQTLVICLALVLASVVSYRFMTTSNDGDSDELSQLAASANWVGQLDRGRVWSLDGMELAAGDFAGIKRFSHLELLSIKDSEISAESARVLGQLNSLQTLAFENCMGLNADYSSNCVQGLNRLQLLRIDNCEVADDIFYAIANLDHLTTVSLFESHLTEESARVLSQMPHLRVIHVSAGYLTERSLKLLASNPRLKLNIHTSSRSRDDVKNAITDLGQRPNVTITVVDDVVQKE